MKGSRSTIVLVDDNLTNLAAGKSIIKTFYQVIPATSAKAMFEVIEEIMPDLILLDIEMPEMDGYETIKRLKSDERWRNIPVIFLTAKDDPDSEVQGFDLGAVDYITKPFSAPMLLKRIEKELMFDRHKKDLLKTQTELKKHLDGLQIMVSEEANTVIRMQDAIFDTVVDMVEFRDRYTGGHIVRTQQYVKALLDEMYKENVYPEIISDWDMALILASAKLHDIGKIAVSDVILGKKARLTEEEFEHMKTHVTAGVDAIERIIKKMGKDDFFDHAIRMAGTHHEKWNGSGYPIGLKGNNIPLEGRLMAIADVYDALICKRQYKEALSHEMACQIIEESSGTQFDPVLVNVFCSIKDQFEQISLENDN